MRKSLDLTGMRFGRLVAEYKTSKGTIKDQYTGTAVVIVEMRLMYQRMG